MGKLLRITWEALKFNKGTGLKRLYMPFDFLGFPASLSHWRLFQSISNWTEVFSGLDHNAGTDQSETCFASLPPIPVVAGREAERR
jgi:hypothetical protein